MKNLLTLILILVCSISINAQSQTYKIEELTLPRTCLGTKKPSELYGGIKNVNLITNSITENLVYEGTHPVLGGFLKAYKEHRPITISPDIMWLLISQGFAQHVNNNAEELRDEFVDFEGQETLVVKRESLNLEDMPAFPWESMFPEFVEKIGSFTGEELIENLSADFTTTTPASLIASQITLMESMKSYFRYKVSMVGCGLPEVTIEGSVEDWEKILKKLDYIEKYDLKWWTSELKPVIKEIIKTKKGKFNKKFWMKMVRYHSEGLYGSLTDIDGWFLKFYPYSRHGERMNLKTIKSIGQLPDEIVRVPFILEVDFEDRKETHEMEFWAGFMGLKQNNQTYNLKPEIGWAINMPGEKEEDELKIE